MMKLIEKLEKSKAFWFLIIISLIFFLLRIPSVIEPHWYGDEGVYQVIGMALNNGQMLYSGIWDNKPPLLYLTYALFQGDQYTVRFVSLVVGVVTMWVFFFLAQKLFKNIRASIIATSVFTILFATPLIEGNIANAENFMLLPIITAGFLIYKYTNHQTPTAKSQPLFAAGLLLGIALLFKIVAIFDFAAFLVFLILMNLPEKISFFPFKKLLSHNAWVIPLISRALFMTVGFIVPLLITFLYFSLNNTLPAFIQAVFSGMFGYVSYGNSFIIPQGLLILKLVLLAAFIVFLMYKRNKISQSTLFILIWISFALFNAFFAQRPYTHYMLVLVPSVSLLTGLIVNAKTKNKQIGLSLLLIIVVATVFTTFKTYPIKKTFLYYQNALLFMTGQKKVTDYQAFFDWKTPRDYQVASYIKMHTKPNDRIFIWGDSPQIYAISNTLPINKYTVAYHIKQSSQGFVTTQQALNTIQPKYVIILSETMGFPFKLDNYTGALSLSNVFIYERNY